MGEVRPIASLQASKTITRTQNEPMTKRIRFINRIDTTRWRSLNDDRQTTRFSAPQRVTSPVIDRKAENVRSHQKTTQRLKIDYSDDFETFWKAYPRRVGKGAAFRAWKNQRRHRPAIDEILNALQIQSRCEQWQTESLIPHPSTWINRHGWLDEMTEAKATGKPSENDLFEFTPTMPKSFADFCAAEYPNCDPATGWAIASVRDEFKSWLDSQR